MEIKVTQEKLSRALGVVSRIATTGKTTLPVLNTVLIQAKDGKVTLSTTNLDMAVVDYLPVSEAKDGKIAVPARLLAEFVANLPRGEVVEITNKDEKVKIAAGSYHSVINGVAADEFPALPEIDEKKAVIFKMPADEFKNGLSKVMIATSSDSTRPALTGVFFNTFEGDLYIAATDGYRLTNLKFVNKVKSEVEAIVPNSSLQEVLRSISDDVDEVEILFDEAQVEFRLGEVEITSKIIDAKYPNYRMLIPEKTTVKMELNRAELMRVTKLAALFARGSGGSIVYEAVAKENKLKVTSVASELGENASEIDTEVEKDANALVNSRYLIDALNVLDAEIVTMEMVMEDKINPIVLKNSGNNDYTHIVMPINL